MLKKIIIVVAVLIGGTIGSFGAWVFHYILDANAPYITGHKSLVALVGTLGLLFFANIVHHTKVRNPRTYSLVVFGIACGIFVQAIFYFKNPCPDDCSTDFVLKLGACVLLMVDGFSALSENRSMERVR